MSYEKILNWALNAQNEFAAMSIKDQIITYALAVVIVILALTLTYWAIKGSLYLTYYSVKLSLYLSYYSVVLSLLIPYGIMKLVFESLKRLENRPVKQIVEKEVKNNDTKNTRFCSQCGKEFTNEMEESIHNNGNCFCEYCGVSEKIRV